MKNSCTEGKILNHDLLVGFNPFQKYFSNLIILPGRGEKK